MLHALTWRLRDADHPSQLALVLSAPVYIYYSYMQPGVPPEFGQERAWGAALVLIAIVMALNIVARLISRSFAPKTGR